MVWKVTAQYRKKVSESLEKGSNEYASAALGEKQPLRLDEDTFILPMIKFPSKLDEVEAVTLFRRCGGPLAATSSGREKLVKDRKRVYYDGRSLQFCRVAGCQQVHSDSVKKRHLVRGVDCTLYFTMNHPSNAFYVT